LRCWMPRIVGQRLGDLPRPVEQRELKKGTN
jgi:hypothetical protein